MSALLEVRNVSKRFPGVRALHRVNLSLNPGEVLAVIGENGAGKSTLMKILAGVQSPDVGDLLVEGEPLEVFSVEHALERGISLIHQELNLADNLTVEANIFLGREPLKNGLIDNGRIREEARKFLDQVGLELDPGEIVDQLPIGVQQMIEIAKALSVNSKILIMDEPTSSLSGRETARLFEVIKDLRSKGVSVIYISHRLGEVKELADRVTVLRDGENAGDLSVDEVNHETMVKLMVGRDVSQFYHHTPRPPGNVVLEVNAVRTQANPKHELSFNVRRGEIVGISGLVGAGRTELLEALFGVEPAVGGEILVDGKVVNLSDPIVAIDKGLVLVPEDRKKQGLVLEMSVRENVSLASLFRDQKRGFLNFEAEHQITSKMILRMNVKTPTHEQIVNYLSGGNQQKVVLGKWLAMNPRVLLLDEPTRGIDVGAKEEIYQLVEKLATEGVAVLFVSSEMEEVLGLSDRAIVMHEGRITGELSREELSEESVMRLATGMTSIAA